MVSVYICGNYLSKMIVLQYANKRMIDILMLSFQIWIAGLNVKYASKGEKYVNHTNINSYKQIKN